MSDILIRDPHRLAAVERVALLDTPVEEAFDRLTRLAATTLAAPIALIVLLAADRQFLKSCYGVPVPLASVRQTPLAYSLCVHMLATRTPLIIPDVCADPRVCDNPTVVEFDVRAYLGVPLRAADGHVLGSLCVYDITPRAWTEREVTILVDLTALVMTEVALRAVARERESFAHRASHDSLTALPNRTLFVERLAHALARADRPPDTLAVLFVDLDGFKAVNDRWGHAAGDRLLVVVAQRLRTCVRAGDAVARLGGDELAVLLDGVAGATEAGAIAARIVAALAAPVPVRGGEAAVTASVGVALNAATSQPADLLHDADRAMYRAKRRGKARHVVSARPARP